MKQAILKNLLEFGISMEQFPHARTTLNVIDIDSYEFILDYKYILLKADVKMGNEKSETYEIIASWQ